MKTTWDDLLSDVEEFEGQLHSPGDYSREMAPAYRKTAVAIATRIIMAAMPPDHDIDRWKAKAARVVQRVTGELLMFGWFRLSLSSPDESVGALAPKDVLPSEQSVTHNDVVEWIKSGEAGKEGGKRITDKDREVMAKAGGGEAGYKAVATIVMRAYYSRKPQASYARMRRVIQKFLFGIDEKTNDPLLDSILVAWEEHFTVRHHRELRRHVASLCRRF